jgi:hypothetical protein
VGEGGERPPLKKAPLPWKAAGGTGWSGERRGNAATSPEPRVPSRHQDGRGAARAWSPRTSLSPLLA